MKITIPTLHSGQVEIYNSRSRLNVVRCGRRYGKDICVNTPIPTPTGWIQNGDIQDGDVILDERGQPCTVITAHDAIIPKTMYDVTFSDGSVIAAGGEHLWQTMTHQMRKQMMRRGFTFVPENWSSYQHKVFSNSGKLKGYLVNEVLTTEQLFSTLTHSTRGDNNHCIPTTQPLDLPPVDLPIDPWLLGYWLGNGSAANSDLSAGSYKGNFDDDFVVAKINRPCSVTRFDERGYTRIGVYGLKNELQSLNLINNKHIPSAYLRASIKQRLELLRGLCDSDGYCSKVNVEFCSMDEGITNAVYELVVSLGERATIITGRAMLNGKYCGEKYRVCWRWSNFNPFSLPRKAEIMPPPQAHAFKLGHRMIVAITPITPRLSRCLTVDSPSRLYLAGRSMIPTHNTRMLETIAESAAIKGKSVGIFAPENKQLAEPFDHIREALDPLITSSNRNEGRIKLKTKGKIDFWTLNDNELAGRGREYDITLIDEAGFTKSPQMLNDIWQKSIKPTMLVTRGSAWVFSTPNGLDTENFFYAICNDASWGFKQFHAPTSSNPYVPLEELEIERQKNHPMVFQQEFLAEFVDWSGTAFFAIDKMLVDGLPVAYPERCDAIFAVMDTAVKGGKEHDGTAIIYCALNKWVGHPLIILDWDVVQIDGALLESYLPTVFARMEELASLMNPRYGVVGTYIEDAAAGAILLQQGRTRGWPTHAIDSKLTSVGKDERAISVSGHFHQEKLKISDYAYNKTATFKGATRNHLLSQVASFRIGDKDAHKRADDLLDCFCYCLALGVGDKYGI